MQFKSQKKSNHIELSKTFPKASKGAPTVEALQHSDQASRLLNFEETREKLNITSSHLRKLVFEKRIPVTRIGRRLRFDENKLNEWIEENTH